MSRFNRKRRREGIVAAPADAPQPEPKKAKAKKHTHVLTESELNGAYSSSHDVVIEEARGLATATPDKYGRLVTDAYQQHVWLPGENEAVCDLYQSSLPNKYDYRGKDRVTPPAHAMSGCNHGFRGNFAGTKALTSTGELELVFRGWGDASIGTEGFRSQFAELVAVAIPQHKNRFKFLKPVNWLFPRRYSYESAEVSWVFAWCAAGIGGIMSLLFVFGGPFIPWLIFTLMFWWGLIVLTTNGAPWRRKESTTYSWSARKFPKYAEKLSPYEYAILFKKLYPNVKVYSSPFWMGFREHFSDRSDFVGKSVVTANLAKLPTPETDPNFWSKR